MHKQRGRFSKQAPVEGVATHGAGVLSESEIWLALADLVTDRPATPTCAERSGAVIPFPSASRA